ncbi:MAG: enoyl-CoA hydratase/isomerase family protein, partial [Actinobacteria bacterium]|nr:enoyl-CoA hydratase/isomerase family protein [Actinomycetota bacterium]
MKSSYTTITVEQQDAVLVVTLNRPDVLNAFDQTMQDELR